ncbi:hypothetical protein SSCG_06303 [Streptomyces clavuligerus]|nr:hypothetical protein SSCG_06303 [Streptomyces clavuligerus]
MTPRQPGVRLARCLVSSPATLRARTDGQRSAVPAGIGSIVRANPAEAIAEAGREGNLRPVRQRDGVTGYRRTSAASASVAVR